jgi:hypothetical protein
MSLAYLCCWVRDKMATHLWFSVRIESGETGGTVRAVGMFPEPVIVGLLESACPSIQYRVRWEILAEPPGSETMEALHEQIQVALEGFQAVMAVESLDDLVEPYKSKLVFKPGVKWPGIYDLRLLAFTQGWRSVQNREIVTSAVKRWVALSPLPVVHVRHKSQLIAPASFGMHDFDPDLDAMGAAQWIRLLKK